MLFTYSNRDLERISLKKNESLNKQHGQFILPFGNICFIPMSQKYDQLYRIKIYLYTKQNVYWIPTRTISIQN